MLAGDILYKYCFYYYYYYYYSLHSPPPPTPLGISRAFDIFSCPGGREFDELTLPGAGHLITTHRGWGI